MSTLSIRRGRGQSNESTIRDNNACQLDWLGKLIAVTVLVGIAFPTSLRAQSSGDPGAPNMSGVTDVTPGWKYLLVNDDLVMLQVTNSNGMLTTSLVSMNTSNSALSGTQQNITIHASTTSTPPFDPTNSVVAAEASGRMFNTPTDMVAVLTATEDGWQFSLANSTGVQSSVLATGFPPEGTVYTQVVMGDFNGDGLADALTFYEDTNFDANGSRPR